MSKALRVVATYKCNKNCSFCYQSKKDSIVLSIENYKKSLLSLKDKEILPSQIVFQGGEITILNELLYEYIDIKNKIFSPTYCSITSNGTATVDYYKRLKMYGVNNITISINKLEKEIEEKVLALCRDGFFTTRINTVYDENNLEDIKKIIDFSRDNSIRLTLCYKMNINNVLNNVDVLNNESLQLEQNRVFNFILRSGYEYSYQPSPYSYCFVDNKNYHYIHYFYNNNYKNMYDNDNYIMLPSGRVTTDFKEVIQCKI